MATIPYPGLRTFKTSEHALFFGQETNADDLFSILGQRHFVAVVGESGCGKSSLVRAGLVPLLLPEWSLPEPSWDVVFTQPGMSPVANLARSLAASRHLKVRDVELLELNMREDEHAVIRLVERSRLCAEGPDAASSDVEGSDKEQSSKYAPKHLLIVVDQFEELFRFRREGALSKHRDDEAAVYVKLLLNAAEKESVDTFVVLTMRSEYLGDSAQFYNLAEAINGGLFLLPRMNRVQCEDAIVEPPRSLNYNLPSALVQRLLNEAEERVDGLPLLQHGLRYLWDVTSEEQRKRGELPLPEKFINEKSKDLIAWSFDEHLDAVYDGLTPDQQQIARRIFKLLGERDPRGRLIRRPTEWCEMKAIGPTDTAVMEVLDHFRDEDGGRTFLVPSKQRLPEFGDSNKVDLSHEVLLRQWSNYATWLNEEDEDSSNYIWLADAAYRKSRGDLEPLQGLELRALVKWRDMFKPSMTWADRYAGPIDPKLKAPRRNYVDAMAFLKESEENAARELADEKLLEEEEKRKLRKRLLVSWLASLTIFVLILFVGYEKIHAAYDLGHQKAKDQASLDVITAKAKFDEQRRQEEAKDEQERLAAREEEGEQQKIIDQFKLKEGEDLARRLTDQRNQLLSENSKAVEDKAGLLRTSEQRNADLTKAEERLRKANEVLRTDQLVDDMRLKYAQLESRADKARLIRDTGVQEAMALSDLRELSQLDRDLAPKLTEDRRRASDAVLTLVSTALTKKLLISDTVVPNLQQLTAGLDLKGHVLSFGILSEESVLPHVAALEHGGVKSSPSLGSDTQSLRLTEFDPMNMTPAMYVLALVRRDLLRTRGVPPELMASATAINVDATMAVIGNKHGWLQFSRPLTPEEAYSRHLIAEMKIVFRLRPDHESINFVQFDRSGKYVIARNENQYFHVIDVAARKVIGSGESPPILAADVSPDGNILSIATSSSILLWRRGPTGEFGPSPDRMNLTSLHSSTQFLDDHRIAGIYSSERCVIMNDVSEKASRRVIHDPYKSLPCSFPAATMAAGPTGLVAVTDGSNVELIGTNEEKSVLWLELQRNAASPITRLVFSRDAGKLLMLRGDGSIQVLNTSQVRKPGSIAQLTAAIHDTRKHLDVAPTAQVIEALLERSRSILNQRELTEQEKILYLK